LPSLRSEIVRLLDRLTRIEPLLQTIASEIVIASRERRQTNEALDAVARQIVELRRDHGLTALHVPPHYTRRRPLG
jgi:hypothetical protein